MVSVTFCCGRKLIATCKPGAQGGGMRARGTRVEGACVRCVLAVGRSGEGAMDLAGLVEVVAGEAWPVDVAKCRSGHPKVPTVIMTA